MVRGLVHRQSRRSGAVPSDASLEVSLPLSGYFVIAPSKTKPSTRFEVNAAAALSGVRYERAPHGADATKSTRCFVDADLAPKRVCGVT